MNRIIWKYYSSVHNPHKTVKLSVFFAWFWIFQQNRLFIMRLLSVSFLWKVGNISKMRPYLSDSNAYDYVSQCFLERQKPPSNWNVTGNGVVILFMTVLIFVTIIHPLNSGTQIIEFASYIAYDRKVPILQADRKCPSGPKNRAPASRCRHFRRRGRKPPVPGPAPEGAGHMPGSLRDRPTGSPGPEITGPLSEP